MTENQVWGEMTGPHLSLHHTYPSPERGSAESVAKVDPQAGSWVRAEMDEFQEHDWLRGLRLAWA